MMKKAYGLAVVLMMALPLAQAAGVSPETISGATTVDGAKAKALFDKGVAFIDTRSDKDWNAGRIPGAKHIDVEKPGFTEEALGKLAKKDLEVVMYCNGVSCPRSALATEKALSWGYKKVYYYRLGFPDWKAAGYPVE
jgi:rhodanese-related sulfurtransferase